VGSEGAKSQSAVVGAKYLHIFFTSLIYSYTGFLTKKLTTEIKGAQNFNFPPKFPHNGFLAPNIVFLEDHFLTKKIPNSIKFRGEAQLPNSATMPMTVQSAMVQQV